MKLANHLRGVAVAISIMGCGSASVATSEPDAGIDGSSVDASDIPLGCGDPTCLYLPPRLPIELVELAVTDLARVGGPREIPIAIRFAPTAPRPMPVVVWSHGGAGGQLDPTRALDQWAIAAAEAGYLSVAIAHVPRDQASREALCASLGFDAAGCATFKFLGYDRPIDIALTIDKLAELATQPQFAGRFDLAKLAVGGHSAGAGGTLMVDGASRDINGVATLISDPRPIAFLAFSPQAAGSDGMTEAGYAQITRPTLIGTGRGDENPPDTADGRAAVYDLMQPGNKARIFVEDAAAIHTVFALELDNCTNGATLARCEQMRDWVKSAGLAFLDAHLRSAPAAIAFLASTDLAVASGGVAEWSTR